MLPCKIDGEDQAQPWSWEQAVMCLVHLQCDLPGMISRLRA
jgi:hypothetical protein